HLGAMDLNEGRNFQIEVISSGEAVKKQVDVYGRIDDVVIVAECKSCAKKQKRPLQKDIGEFASLQRPIANAIRKHYGPTRKLKIIWLMATNNVIWATPDKRVQRPIIFRLCKTGIYVISRRSQRTSDQQRATSFLRNF